MASSAIGLNGPIGLQEGRNKLINGEFNFWQRGNTFNFGISFGGETFSYTSDRWYYYSRAASGVTMTSVEITKEDFPFGEDIDGMNVTPKYFMKLESGNTASGVSGDSLAFLEQRIEDVRSFAGKNATLSFFGKSSEEIKVIQVSAHQFFDGGSSVVHTSGVTLGLSQTWSKYQCTLQIPNIIGKTLGAGATNDHLAIRFNLVSGSSAGYIYDGLNWTQGTTESISLTQIQLEENNKPTNFERLDEESEYQRVERYYEVVGSHITANNEALGTNSQHATNHNLVAKRTSDFSPNFVSGQFSKRNQNRGLTTGYRDKNYVSFVVTANNTVGDIITSFDNTYVTIGIDPGTSNTIDGYIKVGIDNEIHLGTTGGN